jgi:hypothetical protein
MYCSVHTDQKVKKGNQIQAREMCFEESSKILYGKRAILKNLRTLLGSHTNV